VKLTQELFLMNKNDGQICYYFFFSRFARLYYYSAA